MAPANVNRINSVIDFIEQNLENDLSLKVLASRANYSPFHFHRIFTTLTEETPLEFVRRKRIEKIAWVMMKEKSVPIKELAYHYGFDNAVSFSKTFKKYYGVSASQLKRQSTSRFNKIVRENSKNGKEKVSVERYFSNLEHVEKWMKDRGFPNRVFLKNQKFCYVRGQGSFEMVDDSFEKLKQWTSSMNTKVNGDRRWALVIHDNPAITETSRVSHSACLIWEPHFQLTDEIGTLTIPSGYFLVGTFDLKDEEFKTAWGAMSLWLTNNNYTFREGHYFEVFHTDSVFAKEATHKVDICIPVE